MLFLIINTLNTLFKTPQIYELVFPIKNPYAFKKFYFSISLNSEESKTSLIKLNYNPNGILSDSLFIEQRQVFGQRGGFNAISMGFKINEFQMDLKYHFNEMIYIETTQERDIKPWDTIFGKIIDTLYPSDVQGLDRSIIVEYNFDSLYRNLNLTSSGKFSIFSNPITFEIGYKSFLLSLEARFFNQNGNFIEYNAKNYYLSSSPKVKILNYTNYKWLAYLYAIPYINNPFGLKRTFEVDNTSHFSFYLTYYNPTTLLKLGYSPELTIKGKITDEIRYITSLSNNVDSIKYSESYLYAIKNGDTTEIVNYAIVYIFFNYKDTTYTNSYEFSYKIPSSIIAEFYKYFKINFLTISLFLGQKPLNNLYGGFSLMHKFYAKTLSNYGYIYTKNNLLNYHSLFFNVLVPTGSFLFSFGSKVSFYNNAHNLIKNTFKNYIYSFQENSLPIAFSINFQLNYVK